MSTTTTRGALPYPVGTDPDKPRLDLQALATQVAAVAALYAQGTASARPSASAALAGTFYASTDTGAVDYCTGTAWLALVQAATDTSGLATNSTVVHLAGAETVTGSKNFTGGLQDRGAAVYSPNNLPPASGAVIAQTIRGTISLSAQQGIATATIPAVNMAKTQLRFLGIVGTVQFNNQAGFSSLAVNGIAVLTNSTTVTVSTLGSASSTSGSLTASYELTEWT